MKKKDLFEQNTVLYNRLQTVNNELQKYKQLYNQNIEMINSLNRQIDELNNKIAEMETAAIILPAESEPVINIIEELAIQLNKNNIREISLMASEGTILSKIYQKTFENYNIKINVPNEEEFFKIRNLIEIVKQNKEVNKKVKGNFINLLKEQKNDSIILGCTEFPILYQYVKEDIEKENITIYDPLESSILKIKRDNGKL